MTSSVKILLAAVGVVVLAGLVTGGILVTRREDPPTNYDATIEDDFMATCTADAEALGFTLPDDFCQCAFADIRSEVPFDRFLEIDAALQADPDAVPRSIQRIRTRCFIEVEAAGPSLTVETTVPSITVETLPS